MEIITFWEGTILSSPYITYEQFKYNLLEAYEKEGRLKEAEETRNWIAAYELRKKDKRKKKKHEQE